MGSWRARRTCHGELDSWEGTRVESRPFTGHWESRKTLGPLRLGSQEEVGPVNGWGMKFSEVEDNLQAESRTPAVTPVTALDLISVFFSDAPLLGL